MSKNDIRLVHNFVEQYVNAFRNFASPYAQATVDRILRRNTNIESVTFYPSFLQKESGEYMVLERKWQYMEKPWAPDTVGPNEIQPVELIAKVPSLTESLYLGDEMLTLGQDLVKLINFEMRQVFFDEVESLSLNKRILSSAAVKLTVDPYSTSKMDERNIVYPDKKNLKDYTDYKIKK